MPNSLRRVNLRGLALAAMCATAILAPLALTVAATSRFGGVRVEVARYDTALLLIVVGCLVAACVWALRWARAASMKEDDAIEEFRDDLDRLDKRVEPHF